MAPRSDPYATPLQKRVDALLCIFIVVVIALVLRTSAHGQGAFPQTLSVVPQPFWSTLSFFHAQPRASLVLVAPAFLTEGQPDYAAANRPDFSASAGLSGISNPGFSPILMVQEKASAPVAPADLESGSAHRSFASSGPTLAGNWSRVAGVGSTIPDYPAGFSRTAVGALESVPTSQQGQANAAPIDNAPSYVGKREATRVVTAGRPSIVRLNLSADASTGPAYSAKADSSRTIAAQTATAPFAPSSPDAILASATWNSSPTNANWVAGVTDNNWSTGIGTFPGSTSGLTNSDTANFLTSSITSIAINGTPLNIKNIQFGNTTTAPSSYTIGSTGGNSLLLSSGGSISLSSGFTGTTNLTEVINAPLVLEPVSSITAGVYTFQNSAGANSNILQFGGAISGGTTTQGITLTLTGANAGLNTVSGAISDGNATGGVAVSKTSSGTWTLSGNNSYTGGTTVSAGVLKLSGSGTLGSSSGTLAVNGGTLDLNGTSQTVGALNGSGGLVRNSNSGNSSTLTVGNGGASGSYAGSVALNTGTTLSLTKVGSGTQSLTNDNSYTGATLVAGGTLRLANANGLALSGTSSISVNGGGTLLMAANNQVYVSSPPPITLAGGKLDGGGFTQGTGGNPLILNTGTIGLGALTLTSSSIIDLTGTSVLHFSNSSSSTWTGTLSIYNWGGTPVTGGGTEQILFGGTSAGLSALQLTQVSFYSDAGVTQLSNTALILADGEIIPGALIPVPEPSTWAAGFLAMTAVACAQRRRFASKRRKARIGGQSTLRVRFLSPKP